jgi:hypothetical protein
MPIPKDSIGFFISEPTRLEMFFSPGAVLMGSGFKGGTAGLSVSAVPGCAATWLSVVSVVKGLFINLVPSGFQ